MSIPRVNGAGWGTNDKLLSTQITQVDINTSWALDKRTAQTDTLQSTVTFTGVFIANGDIHGTTTPSATWVIGGSHGMQFGCPVGFQSGADPHVFTGCTFVIDAGGTLVVDGATTINGNVDLEGTMSVGGAIDLGTVGQIRCPSGTSIAMSSGSSLALGGVITLTGANALIVCRRTLLPTTPSTQTIDTSADEWVIPEALAADTTFNIADGTIAGQTMRIVRIGPSSAHSASLFTLSAVPTIGVTVAATKSFWVDLHWGGAAWTVTGYSQSYSTAASWG